MQKRGVHAVLLSSSSEVPAALRRAGKGKGAISACSLQLARTLILLNAIVTSFRPTRHTQLRTRSPLTKRFCTYDITKLRVQQAQIADRPTPTRRPTDPHVTRHGH